MRQSSKPLRMWGRYSEGKLDTWGVMNGYGRYFRVAIYTSRRDARRQYQDVRRVEIKEIARGK